MNDKFDELAKGMAQSVSRRGVLKKFGLGLVGIALASLGLPNSADAGEKGGGNCNHCVSPYGCTTDACFSKCSVRCSGKGGW